jgi:hypothetical protein
MENETMGNEGVVTEQPVNDDGTPVSQSAMSDDFDKQYEIIDEDTGKPYEPKTEDEQPVQDTTAQQPVQPESKKPDGQQQTTQVTDYTKELYKEDGNLDVEKAIALFGAAGQTESKQQPVQQPEPSREPPKPNAGAAQEETDPFQQARKSYTAALDLQRYYIGKGHDPEQAMAMAERDIDEHLNRHFLKSEIEKMREDFNKEKAALLDQVKSERELARAEPIAEKNLIGICSKFAKGMSAETLRNAIFDINLGGRFLTDLFIVSNPDKAKLTGNELGKEMNDWFIKNAAKSNTFLESLAINAINQIQRKVQPELVKLIQQNALQRQGIQQKTKPGPATPQSPKPQGSDKKSQAMQDLDAFFHDVPRDERGRPHI